MAYCVGHYLQSVGSEATAVPLCACGKGAICFGLTYLCCPCIIGYEMRSELRHVEDIDGSYLQDLLCMWCCHPCNLCQMYGHVRLKVRATMAIAPDLPATYEKPACDMER